MGRVTFFPSISKLLTELEEIFSNFRGLLILGTRDGTLEKDLLLSFVSSILLIFYGYVFPDLCSGRSND